MAESPKKQFEELDKALEKGEKVLDFTAYGDESSKYNVYEIEERLQMYAFGDVTIVKNNHKTTSFMREKYTNPSEPLELLISIPHDSCWTIYYVLKGNEAVTNKDKIKELIQKATDIKLTKLDNSEPEKYKRADKHIETDFSIERTFKKMGDLDFQPNAKEIKKQAKYLAKFFGCLHEEIGFKNIEQVAKYLKGIKKNAVEFS